MLKWPDVLKLAKDGNPAPVRKVVKTEAEWRQHLTDEQYRVTRQAGTERAFSSEMCSLFEPGLYSCVCCDTLLFDSNEKFESHTGWPSFTQPIGPTLLLTSSMARPFWSESRRCATPAKRTWVTCFPTAQSQAVCVIA